MDTPRGTRCLRLDFPVYELAGERVLEKRGDVVDCDYHACMEGHPMAPGMIFPGDLYARTSTGLRFCSRHFTESDIVSLTPRGV